MSSNHQVFAHLVNYSWLYPHGYGLSASAVSKLGFISFDWLGCASEKKIFKNNYRKTNDSYHVVPYEMKAENYSQGLNFEVDWFLKFELSYMPHQIW